MARMRQSKLEPATQEAAVNGSPGEVLTLAEAANYLKLSESDVLRLVKDQGLPARRLANEWRFLKAAIQRWLCTGSPEKQSSKEALLTLAGKYKDDPELEAIVVEAMRLRGRSAIEGD